MHAALAEAPGSRSIQRTVSRMPEFMLSGPVVAIVTPFKCDSLRVDDESLIKYLQVLLLGVLLYLHSDCITCDLAHVYMNY